MGSWRVSDDNERTIRIQILHLSSSEKLGRTQPRLIPFFPNNCMFAVWNISQVRIVFFPPLNLISPSERCDTCFCFYCVVGTLLPYCCLKWKVGRRAGTALRYVTFTYNSHQTVKTLKLAYYTFTFMTDNCFWSYLLTNIATVLQVMLLAKPS